MKKENIRIGVVGTGAIGRSHMERINKKLHGGWVTACTDANLKAGQTVAEQYGCKLYESGEALIASAEIDAVIVTTADMAHEKYVLEAVKQNKYVFCEKPLAPEPEACRRIVEAEMKGKRHLVQVGFMRRYDMGYRQLKEAVKSGIYGEPLLLHCAHRNPAVDESYTTKMAVENSMIHEIDVLRWLLEEDYATVEVVFSKNTRRAHERLRDPQTMILTTKSGVRIDVEAFVNTGHCYDIKCEICCEDGILNLPEPANIRVCADGKRGYAVHGDWSERFEAAYDTELQEWIDGVRRGRIDGPTAWDGYVGQVTAGAASKASDKQETVEIEIEERPKFYRE